MQSVEFVRLVKKYVNGKGEKSYEFDTICNRIVSAIYGGFVYNLIYKNYLGGGKYEDKINCFFGIGFGNACLFHGYICQPCRVGRAC